MYGLDLFSGIGGITLSLQGYVRPVAYCENDRYAQCVLLSRMSDRSLPLAPIWDDVRTLHGSMLPPVDIIYGGFPCQDISVAGRGEGLGGERSGLFFEIIRLVGEIRPRFVFLENVAAITVRGAERVVGELCRLRYDCRWGILSAADVGANHRRARWWLLAHAMPPEQRRDKRKNEAEKDVTENSRRKHGGARGQIKGTIPRIVEDIETRSNYKRSDSMEHADGSGLERLHAEERRINLQSTEEFIRSWWETEPRLDRVGYGIPNQVDRLRGLGNSVVPAQAREAFERLLGIK